MSGMFIGLEKCGSGKGKELGIPLGCSLALEVHDLISTFTLFLYVL